MRRELQTVLAAIREMAPEELPRLMGDLEELRATAQERLLAPATPQVPRSDELLDITRAAQRLSVSEKFLYKNAIRLPFTRRMGRNLRFSSLGIDSYIRQQRP